MISSKVLPRRWYPLKEVFHVRAIGSMNSGRISAFTKGRVDSSRVYAVNAIDFSEINVYGFGYNNILAEYSEKMQDFVHDTALGVLVREFKYPKSLCNQRYIPGFFIRGLHYCVDSGLMMKMDERSTVQLDTVHRGLEKLSGEEAYRELHKENLVEEVSGRSCLRGVGNLQQLTDSLAIPKSMLLANVVDFYTTNQHDYDPLAVFADVEKAVNKVQTDGYMLKELQANVDKYLKKDCLVPLIGKLKRDGKKLFIVTNSGILSLDVGMTHMLGNDWLDAFEAVVVFANNPSFLSNHHTALGKILHSSRLSKNWQSRAYVGGCRSQLLKLKEWEPSEVIYFGEHIFADRSNPENSNSWHCGAVLPELDHEIDEMNTETFSTNSERIQALDELIERAQRNPDAKSEVPVTEWWREKERINTALKETFNVHFGPVFRSSVHRSYFYARISQVAEVCMSSVKNLMNYAGDSALAPSSWPPCESEEAPWWRRVKFSHRYLQK